MTLRVGFLGYGFMGRAHANALARLPMFFPDAPAVDRHILVGRDASALADAADRLGFDRTTTDWRVAVDAVDVLYNLGPNDLHADPCVRALETGTHVLCEKPLADTIDAAERMAAAARDSDAVAACGFNYRHVPALALAKRLLEAGTIGDVRHVRGQYLQDTVADPAAAWTWRMDADRAGYGRVADVGTHTIDLARWLVGDITGVTGRLRTFVDERPVSEAPDAASATTRPVETDDAYAAIAAFETGAQGVFEASRVARGHKATNAIEVLGTEGGLRFDLERLNELELIDADGRGFERLLVTEPTDPYLDAWWPPGHGLGWEHSVVHENYEFLRAIAGEPAAVVPISRFDDGLAAQRVVEAVVESHDTGRWIAL